jgi:hypothetical protein
LTKKHFGTIIIILKGVLDMKKRGQSLSYYTDLKAKLARITLIGNLVLAGAALGCEGYSVIKNSISVRETTAYEETLEALNKVGDVEIADSNVSEFLERKYYSMDQHGRKRVLWASIDETFNGDDLDFLKYFPNLETLTIKAHTLDCEDLMYNSNLHTLRIYCSTIINMDKLPNSITKLEIRSSELEDGRVVVPYDCKSLSLDFNNQSNIVLKNPESLREIFINNDCLTDLNDIADCTNLRRIEFKLTSNVLNKDVLYTLPNLETVIGDDFSPMYFTGADYDALNIVDKSIHDSRYEAYELDRIYNQIIPDDSISEEAKMEAITRYILDKLSYDYDSEVDHQLVFSYNKLPVYYALNSDKGICVNYSALATALFNRAGISNYRYSNVDHSWNETTINGVTTESDLTQLDSNPENPYVITNDKDSNGHYLGIKGQTAIDYFDRNEGGNLYYYKNDNLAEIMPKHYEKSNPVIYSNDDVEIGYVDYNKLYFKFSYRMNYAAIAFIIGLVGFNISMAIKKKKVEEERINNLADILSLTK